MGDIYTLLCLRSAELSKAFGLRNLGYYIVSVVLLLEYSSSGISQKLESDRKKICPVLYIYLNAAYLNS